MLIIHRPPFHAGLVDDRWVDRFHFERQTSGKCGGRLAGVDEAGRGPLAGAVVAAAVILPVEWHSEGVPVELCGLNDSKQLTIQQREAFFVCLTQNPAIHWAIGESSNELIDSINILQATNRAMNQALRRLKDVRHALVDGRPVKGLVCEQTAIVKGDALSYSIAAASVIAKVTRDRYMVEAEERWPGYGFAVHKGYGTPDHLAALERLGPCPIHRRSFAPLRKPDPELFTS
ncbi:MAG TPA: ribonuclease HII [Candidatus Limnocylindria bacterium]|jgi:ribonuclease HII|nr:ribonuclease HII [Candidatus Limnocylindria bacterium]